MKKLFNKIYYALFPYLEPCYAVVNVGFTSHLFGLHVPDRYIKVGITFDEAVEYVNKQSAGFRSHLIIEDMRKN